MRLNRWFSERVGERALVNVQSPVELSAVSEPEPDLTLLVPRESFYAERHPRPREVLLLVEVAGTSYDHDRQLKLPLYAQAGIAEVWVVALETRAIEVYRQPAGGAYREVERIQPGQALSPLAFPDLVLRVADVVG